MQHAGLMDVARRDQRYAYEAYEFVFAALEHTQKLLGRVRPKPTRENEPVAQHVAGAELVRGACELAKSEFGRMARIVFHVWGINSTDDFGAIVFNLIDANLLTKTDSDSRDDFRDLFDLDDTLKNGFEILREDKDAL
jgi:uncharacterized repeat protein (TIGR04138 family)